MALIILYLEAEVAVAWMIHQAYLVVLSPYQGNVYIAVKNSIPCVLILIYQTTEDQYPLVHVLTLLDRLEVCLLDHLVIDLAEDETHEDCTAVSLITMSSNLL